jgi:hypothetical protein
MTTTQVNFHNKLDVSVQAQIYAQYTLLSTGTVESGDSCILSNESEAYDIYIRDAATGRMFARQFGSDATDITLRKERGLYVIDAR